MTTSPSPYFDHHSPQCNADPVAYYAQHRSACPVAWTDAHEGYWYTTRWDDVVRVARDDAAFSSERQRPDDGVSFVIPRGGGLPQYPIELDPPASVAYRELINPFLTAAAVEKLRPMIAELTSEIVDEFIESGSCDLVADLTNPLPTAVTLRWLGFPDEDGPLLAGPVHDIFAAPVGSERAQRGIDELGYLEQRVRQLLVDRRLQPRDDVLTELVNARHPSGREFTDDELVSVTYLLVAGGVDTTTSLTGSVLVWLAKNPAQRQRLIDEPDLLPGATEEFLRVFAPSQSMARTATTDTEVGGCPVAGGQRVLIPWVAANHDPEVFDDPETVDLDRDARRHLSFGIGSHRCAGAHLARAMFTEMITAVLTRLPAYEVLESGLVPYPTLGNQAGWDSVPAVFTPGPRAAHTRGPAVPQTTLRLKVGATRTVADRILEITLHSEDGTPLPRWEPGAHLPITLPSGLVRQYSLCGNTSSPDTYRIAVLMEPAGRGGSAEMHATADSGVTLNAASPRNHFALQDADDYTFVAGGIGVTPILPMVTETLRRGARVRMLYLTRAPGREAYLDELTGLLGDRLTLVHTATGGRPDLAELVGSLPSGGLLYCCGPGGLIDYLSAAADAAGLTSRVHTERFAASGRGAEPDDTSFTVRLARTGVDIDVAPGQTLLDAISEVVPGVPSDCSEGYCGACETRVIAGEPIHRDTVLTRDERAANTAMMVCVGRAASTGLVLDL